MMGIKGETCAYVVTLDGEKRCGQPIVRDPLFVWRHEDGVLRDHEAEPWLPIFTPLNDSEE